MNNIKMIHGIDSLYYFCESNDNYDNLYLDILDQIENIKAKFDKKEIEFENRDINIHVNEVPLSFLGKAEGFYWFKDINDYFKIGFKDKYKNKTLNDIRVQLLGIGIYTIGIKSLLDFINTVLLKEYVTGFYPITRADLNTFVQYDFSFVNKEMFSTRKRQYSTISEIGNSTSTQTLYVGKAPFKLRLYNKKEELKKSNKKDLMNEYFLNNDFNLEDSIFNIEFELHRTFLRTYNIQTIEDLLSNAVKIFKASMDDIRLIDLNNITDKDIINNSKSRATTLPIWKHIQDSYKLDDFLQIQLPLNKIKRVISIYDDYKFKLEYIALLRKAFINNLVLDTDFLNSLYIEAKDSLTKATTSKELKKRYIPVEIVESKNSDDVKEMRLLEDGSLIKPVSVETVSSLQDYDLLVYLDMTKKKSSLSLRDRHIYEVALREAMNRNLLLEVWLWEL